MQIKQSTTRLQRILEFFLLVLFLFTLGGTTFYAVYFDEISQSIEIAGCFLNENLGLKCPTCGGSRALYHLASGDLLQALHYNFVVIAFIPLVLYYGTKSSYYIIIKKNLARISINTKFIWSLLFFVILFTLMRNIL